jgi:glycosyltransferase involved in cell wall biosynthesis
VPIRIVPMDRRFLGNFPVGDRHRPATYARLQLPDVLKELDRVLYLDPDLIVRRDIAELWNSPLTNVSAVVSSRGAAEPGAGDIAFNTGVMVLNLARLRGAGFVSRAIAFAKDHADQTAVAGPDILHSLWKDDVARFPQRWNVTLPPHSEGSPNAEQDPAIVHFAGPSKPWHCSPTARRHPWYDEYFRYVDRYQERIGDLAEPREAPRISVIMPCRNVEPFLQQAVESVLRQRMTAIEVTALNDGSTDLTGRMLDDFARWDRRITVLHQENRGLGATYNRGLDRATAEYVAFVEPDDWVDVDGFDSLIRQAERLRCDIVKADFFLVEGTEINRYCKYRNERLPEVCRFHDITVAAHGHVGFWAGLYRREFLTRNSIRFLELPGAGYVDASFLWISHVLAESISVIDHAVYYYRQHPGASIGTAAFSKNWPLLIRNYEVVMDFLVAKGMIRLYADNMLHVLYLAVLHMLSMLEPEQHAELIRTVRPLFVMIYDVDNTRLPLPADVRRGIRALQKGASPVGNGVKQQLKRRFRWITKDPRTAADVSRIRHSPIVRALKGCLRWGGECLSLIAAAGRLCGNAVRSLLPSSRGRNRPLGSLSAHQGGSGK